MGLKCSFLGHAYADPEIARERDDRGDEVVVTVREVRTCTRCGTEEVVSENTEVRRVEPAPEPDPEPATEPDESADVGAAPGLDDEFETPQSAAEDDGVILEDDDEPAEGRQPGEWPAADDTRVCGAGAADADTAASEDDAGSEATPWPDTEGEDAGFDAEPDAGEGEVEMGGLTPEGVTDGPEADPEGETVGTDEALDSGIEGDRTPGSAAEEVDVDAVFVCASCDHSVSVIDSSLREGDICPACQQGYLAERSPTRN